VKRRRLILTWVLLLLPGVLAGVQWRRSYSHRDIFVWGNERPGPRREVCRLYSSSGRFIFLSHSYPVPDDEDGNAVPFAFYSGDRAATAERAQEAYSQIFQAGPPTFDVAGVMYARHLGALSSGEHLWTCLIVPWWLLGVAALIPAASVGWRRGRAALVRRRNEEAPASPAKT
jgi:hypothetical protein